MLSPRQLDLPRQLVGACFQNTESQFVAEITTRPQSLMTRRSAVSISLGSSRYSIHLNRNHRIKAAKAS